MGFLSVRSRQRDGLDAAEGFARHHTIPPGLCERFPAPYERKAKKRKPEKGDDHRRAGADGDEKRQHRRRHAEPEARGEQHAGRIDPVIDREPRRGDDAVADQGANERRLGMAEGYRPVEQEIDEGGDDEAGRTGELRRQAAILRPRIGDGGVDDVADEPDQGEGRNLGGDAALTGRRPEVPRGSAPHARHARKSA
jgi:hypothetical protein